MTIVIPDARTPAGVKCWVRDWEADPWLEKKYGGLRNTSFPFYAQYSAHWRFCRLDDPETGWVENTGVQPDVNGPIEFKLDTNTLITEATASDWNWSKTEGISRGWGRITHWRYPRETKEPEMKQHPQADILRRIADGEDLTGRLWRFTYGEWYEEPADSLINYPNWTLAISDEPGTPPPLPRKMIQLRKDGPKYYQGETVAPAGDAHVWVARPGALDAVNHGGFGAYALREDCLRLGLVHLSEENYRLHMAALEDLLEWAKEGGVK